MSLVAGAVPGGITEVCYSMVHFGKPNSLRALAQGNLPYT